MTEIVLGLDLDAANLRVGALTPAGELLHAEQAPMQAGEGPQAGLERIAGLAQRVLARAGGRLLGLGVAAAGPVDAARGRLLNPGALPGWGDAPLAAALSERFDAPACVENAADAAALGEYWMGAGQGAARLYAVTVDAGIRTAFVIDGEVYRGQGGSHPEGGHQIVDPSGPECSCGARGCWESWASGTAIAQAARRVLELWLEHDRQEAAGRPGQAAPPDFDTPQSILLQLCAGDPARVDARLTAEAARQGDPVAAAVIRAASERFALGIRNLLMLFQPEVIVLGGEVLRSSDLFLRDIEHARRMAQAGAPAGRTQIRLGMLGDHAGIYGAAFAILKQLP